MMAQNLLRLIKENRNDVLNDWFHQFIGAYPPETVKYFEKVNNTFTNPIGSNVHKSMIGILDELLGAGDADKLYKDLEMILRIKAVQDVSPSKSVAFLFALKSIIQKLCQKEIADGSISTEELMAFFDELDTLSLLAFNIYTESRELIYDMRIREIKANNDILQKANLLNEAVDAGTFMRCSNYTEPQESAIPEGDNEK